MIQKIGSTKIHKKRKNFFARFYAYFQAAITCELQE